MVSSGRIGKGKRRIGAIRGMATLALVIGGAALLQWGIARGPLDEPWGVSATGREWVDADFTRCGQNRANGRGQACVIDGDTFRLGKRKIRILGIDAPEVGEHARCPDEARRGETATARLQALLSAGRFEMVARKGDEVDQYGRELRTLRRSTAEGKTASIAAQLRAEKLVHRYDGRKTTWCA